MTSKCANVNLFSGLLSVSPYSFRTDQSPNVNIPQSVDNDQQQPHGARLNLGAIIALGAFGGFVFLAAIITTIVVLVRRYVTWRHCYYVHEKKKRQMSAGVPPPPQPARSLPNQLKPKTRR